MADKYSVTARYQDRVDARQRQSGGLILALAAMLIAGGLLLFLG
ncbi:hypothetical protein J2T55_000065 [Methylohalomonas lacus]|uniref:Uncharacterized protein n=1 Tax=Methylohalomonas lacus TaxID=398773 RepID=A0AAE3HJ09_9GAMM|nr:hypothetical protein [Methylohalomonas lacus]MCS3902073.1 hypothetical protein [Methylohalomonas lacus]